MTDAEQAPEVVLKAPLEYCISNFEVTADTLSAVHFGIHQQEQVPLRIENLFNLVMPTLAFGLKPAKQGPQPTIAGQKRKQTLFDDEASDPEENGNIASVENVSTLGTNPRPSKSPRLEKDAAKNGAPSQKYSNLSALHSAKKYTEEANNLDATIYDYDNAYETFHVPKETDMSTTKASGPKYMTSLMQSAEVRKRDQLRAKERLLQKERETEGDEFADKERFVTGAYKAQQEEVKRMEEEEVKREAEEEEKRRKGGGMSGFYKDLLRKDENRSKQISKAAQDAAARQKDEVDASVQEADVEKTDAKIAAELNEKGARIVVKDDG